MSYVKKLTGLFAVLCILASMTTPVEAQVVNNQDEIVYIDAAAFTQRGAPGRGADGGGGEGNAEGKDGILTIFRSSNKQDVQNYVTEMFELQNANGAEVAAYVDEAVALEGGVSKELEYEIPGTGKMRHFLQVVTTEAQMPSISRLIKTLDLPEMMESGDPDFEIRMRYRRASDVANIMVALGVEDVFADDVTNTLHFEDSESKLSLVDFYDVPPLQIQFRIEIIEVREEDASKVGVDWDAWKRSIAGGAEYTGGTNSTPRLDWLLSLDSATLADFLSYTAQSGNADIKQHAVLNINNGATGTLTSTRGVPMYDFAARPAVAAMSKDSEPPNRSWVTLAGGQTAATKAVAVTAAEAIDISITPIIGTELVTIDLTIATSTLNGFDDLDRPIVARQTFATSITLKDLQSLHAATIERSVEVKTRRGIPGLRDIPVLKYLFSVESKKIESSKIFVIITPCYCESVSYEARLKGGPGDILRFQDYKVPAYIPRATR